MVTSGNESGVAVEAQSSPVKGSAIFDAVLLKAKSERQMYKFEMENHEHAVARAQSTKDNYERAREQWEQCIAFLDANFPGWERVIPDDDLMMVKT